MGCRKQIIRFTAPAYENNDGRRILDDVLLWGSRETPEQIVEQFKARLPDITVEDCGRLLDGLVLDYSWETVRVMSDEWEAYRFPYVWIDGAKTKFSYTGWKHQTIETEPKWRTVNHFYPGFERPAEAGEDNSRWIDEGTAVCYVCYVWDAAPDATEQVKADCEAWAAEGVRIGHIKANAKYFRKAVDESINKAVQVKQGDLVEVVKGRKVPKGRDYWVSYVGEGQYGAYANLRSKDGKEFKFVSLDNLEVQVQWGYSFGGYDTAFGLSPTVVQLLRAYAGKECDWGIVCDAIADMDSGEYAGEEFASYLRN